MKNRFKLLTKEDGIRSFLFEKWPSNWNNHSIKFVKKRDLEGQRFSFPSPEGMAVILDTPGIQKITSSGEPFILKVQNIADEYETRQGLLKGKIHLMFSYRLGVLSVMQYMRVKSDLLNVRKL